MTDVFPRRLLLPTLFVVGWAVAAVPSVRAQQPQPDIEKISESPDKLFIFQRHLDPHRTDAGFSSILEIKNAKTGKTLVAWPSTGHLATALWSPGAGFVAVNDYRPTSGDSVYIAVLKNDSPKLIRQPNERELAETFSKITKHHEPITKASLAVDGWENGNVVRARLYGKTALISFDEPIFYEVSPDSATIQTKPPPPPKAVPVEPAKSKKHGAKNTS